MSASHHICRTATSCQRVGHTASAMETIATAGASQGPARPPAEMRWGRGGRLALLKWRMKGVGQGGCMYGSGQARQVIDSEGPTGSNSPADALVM